MLTAPDLILIRARPVRDRKATLVGAAGAAGVLTVSASNRHSAGVHRRMRCHCAGNGHALQKACTFLPVLDSERLTCLTVVNFTSVVVVASM